MTVTFEQIKEANSSIVTTAIERKDKNTGKVSRKDYAEVNQRIKAFRMVYPTGQILTEMVSNENGVCVFRASVYTEDGIPLATGTAYEKESSSFINKTSYIENCETSAVGRALGMAGFGIDVSVASYEEVANAIENQNPKKQEEPKGDDGFTNLLIEVKNAQTRMDDLGIDFRDDKKVRSWVINKSGVETTDIGQMTEPMLKEVLKAYKALINAKEKSMKA